MGCGASSEENEQPATSKLAERKRQKRLQNQNGNTSGENSSADQSPNASNSAKYKKRESTHWAPVTAASPEAGKVSPSSDANKLAVPAASDPDESLGSSELFKALMKPGSPKAGAAVDKVSTAENDEATPADSGAPGGASQQDEGAWSPDGEPLIPTQ